MVTESEVKPQTPEAAAQLTSKIEAYRAAAIADACEGLGVLRLLYRRQMTAPAVVDKLGLDPEVGGELLDTAVHLRLLHRTDTDGSKGYYASPIGMAYNSALQPHELPSVERELLQNLKTGRRTSYAIFEAVNTGLPEVMRDGRVGIDQIRDGMRGTDIDAMMESLMRSGIVDRTSGKYGLTKIGYGLWGEVPNSQAAMAQLFSTNTRAWEQLTHTIKTGNPSFDQAYGVGFWDYIRQHPDVGKIFYDAMSERLGARLPAALAAYDFTLEPGEEIHDIGSGVGEFAAGVLNLPQNRGATGVLFDKPEVAAAAKELIRKRGLEGRARFQEGNFFEGVPEGRGMRLLSAVLHDYRYPDAARILANIRRVMATGDRLAILEFVLPPVDEIPLSVDGSLNPALSYKWHMRVVVGGVERTEEQFRGLLTNTGFNLNRVVPTRIPGMAVIEALPV